MGESSFSILFSGIDSLVQKTKLFALNHVYFRPKVISHLKLWSSPPGVRRLEEDSDTEKAAGTPRLEQGLKLILEKTYSRL